MSFENKYAPQTWADLAFADTDVRDFLAHYAEGRSFEHILLHGPHGSGKSEAAKVIVASSYGRTVQDTELDIVEHIDEIKDAIKAWRLGARFGYTCMMNKTTRPYAIIQEVDAYEAKTQLKLRALMDTMSQARFIFTTNRLENVDKGIRDRCDCFELEVPSPADFVSRAQDICRAERVVLRDAEVEALLASGTPTVRKYMRALEKVAVRL